ncbi:MAG: hypothetical protein ABI948_02480 [Thermoleophilia bacterium]
MPDYGSNIWDDLKEIGDGVRGSRILHHGTEELRLVRKSLYDD